MAAGFHSIKEIFDKSSLIIPSSPRTVWRTTDRAGRWHQPGFSKANPKKENLRVFGWGHGKPPTQTPLINFWMGEKRHGAIALYQTLHLLSWDETAKQPGETTAPQNGLFLPCDLILGCKRQICSIRLQRFTTLHKCIFAVIEVRTII
jgi:hypothetical protein